MGDYVSAQRGITALFFTVRSTTAGTEGGGERIGGFGG